MKRVWIFSAWLFGTTVPMLCAAAFLFGCCVLPFHRAIHRMLPLCRVAAEFLHGDHEDADHQHPSSTPAPEKQQIKAPTLLTTLPAKQSFPHAGSLSARVATLTSATAYRSFITLGAARCDQDVGLQRLLIETFRI